MKKNNQIVIGTIVLIVITFSYKYLVNLFLPEVNYYVGNFIQLFLRAVTLIAYITKLGWWNKIGSLKRISLKSIYIMLPIIILSFIPLMNGFKENSMNVIILLLINALLIGFSEECVNRGIILSALKPKGRKEAILISSLIFGLFHLSTIFFGANIGDTLIQIIFAFGFGLVMAVVRYETDLLLPVILVHAFWDFTIHISKPSVSSTIYILLLIRIALVLLLGIYLTFRGSKKTLNSYEVNEKN